MPREAFVSPGAPSPGGPYSHAVVAGGFLYTAGLGPQAPGTSEVVGCDIETQTRQVMRNLAVVLGERGLDFSDVVKTTVHLQEPGRDFAGFNGVYAEFVVAPYPVRTTVGSTLAGILVEIDLVAVLRG